MELMTAIYERRAVRDYTPAAIDEASIKALIDAAIQAPSAMNQQPWSFCVVRDQALMSRISSESKAYMLRNSPVGLVSHHFEEMLSNSEFHIFYHAPVLILISAVAESPWSVIDCTLAAQNLMLAAHGMGLGSCWIGFAQGWLGTPEGKAALGLPTSYLPIAPIIVGHPKPADRQTAKRNDAEVHWIG